MPSPTPFPLYHPIDYDDDDDSLTGGEIAGIVLGAVFGVLLLVGMVVFFLKVVVGGVGGAKSV